MSEVFMARNYHEMSWELKREAGRYRQESACRKKRGASAWDPRPQRSRSGDPA